MRTLVWQASAKEPNFRERRKAEVQLRGTPQPVEKVVVGPVGSPKEPENKSKTLRKQRIRPRTGGTIEREGVFQHAGVFSEIRIAPVLYRVSTLERITLPHKLRDLQTSI